MELLLKNGILKNTHRGFINPNRRDEDGCEMRVGYYPSMRGRHRYIEDWYANKAANLEQGKTNNGQRKYRNKKENRHNG